MFRIGIVIFWESFVFFHQTAPALVISSHYIFSPERGRIKGSRGRGKRFP